MANVILGISCASATPPLAPIPTHDYSLLPATAAVVSATLVAIVGGLFISAIVSEREERERRRGEVRRLTQLRNATKSDLKKVEWDLAEARGLEWLADPRVLNLLLDAGGSTDKLTEITGALEAPLSATELKLHLKKWSEIIRAAFADIKPKLDLQDVWQPSALRALDSMSLWRTEDAFRDRIYEEVYRWLYKDKKETEAEPLHEANFVLLKGLPPTKRLEEKKEWLARQVAQDERHLAAEEYVLNFQQGRQARYRLLLGMLAVAVIVGVLAPMFALAWGSPENSWLQAVMVLTVLISFVAVLIGLTAEARPLGRKVPAATGQAAQQKPPATAATTGASDGRCAEDAKDAGPPPA